MRLATLRKTPAPRTPEAELMEMRARFPDFRLELVKGEVQVMPPTGGESGRLEGAYTGELYLWTRTNEGTVYGPSTGFRLPGGDIRSADAALVLPGNPVYGLTWQGFVEGIPDFLIEVRSPSDSMPRLREKMKAWMAAGCRLGWLIDPVQRRVFVYTQTGAARRVRYEQTLTGLDIAPGFSVCSAELDPRS